MKLSGEMQSVTVRDIPTMWNLKKSVSRTRGIILQDERDAVPEGLRCGDVKPAASWQAQFQGGKRLIARVAKLVVRIDANPRIRSRCKVDADLLFLNGVPGPRSGGAGAKPNPCGDQKGTKKRAEL